MGGVDVGTSADDEVIYVGELSVTACETINKALTGSTAVAVYTTAGPSNRHYERLNRDGTFSTSNVLTSELDLPVLPGCSGSVGNYVYYDIIKQN